MIVTPTPTIVITPALVMLATAVFELVYVNAPVLFEVGGTNVKGAFPTVFAGIENCDNVGKPLLTTRVLVVSEDVVSDPPSP